MAKEGSIAPKERVNIVYRPSTGDAREEVELPLKLLVIGDFTLRPDDRPIEEREPINIDKENFNQVLKGQNLRLSLSVPDKISGQPDREFQVSLAFDSLRDFEPEAVVSRTPELNRLLELRNALKALKGPMSNRPEFRKKLQELVTNEAARQKILSELKLEE